MISSYLHRVIRFRQQARRSERGYILIATSLSIIFLLGVLGLALDIGRMFVAKNEAQVYVDSASSAPAKQLDGTSAGITRANAASLHQAIVSGQTDPIAIGGNVNKSS